MSPKKPQLSVHDQLKLFPIFENLDEELIRIIESRLVHKSFRKNRFIYKINDPAEHVYFLVKGNIKIGANSLNGKEVIKAIIHPEATFGEMSIFGEETRESFAICIENDTKVLEMSKVNFIELMENYPALANNVIRILSKKLHFAEKRIESLVFKDARERIIDFLKDSAKNFGKQIGYEMLLKHSLTQQDIANFTGTSRQTVTSVLNDLKKSNQIYFKRRSILIRDMTSLS